MFSTFSTLSSNLTTLIKVVAGLQPLTVATFTGYSLTGAGFYKYGSIGRDTCIATNSDGKYILVSASYELTTSRRLLFSSDSGQTFTRIDGTSNLPGGVPYGCHALDDTGQYQFTIATGGVIYRSTDYGSTWTSCYTNAGTSVIDCDGTGRYVLANVTSGIAYSLDYGVNWTTSAIYGAPLAVSISNNGNYWIFGQNNNVNGILMSTDYGSSWTVIRTVSESMSTVRVTDSGTVFSTTFGSVPTNLYYYNGTSWTNIKSLTVGAMVSINRTGQIIFVGTNRTSNNQAVYSLDGGATFANLPGGNSTLPMCWAVSSIGNCAYHVTNIAGSVTGAVYRTHGNYP